MSGPRRVPTALEKRFASLSKALGQTPEPPAAEGAEADAASGYLVVRASGANANRQAIDATGAAKAGAKPGAREPDMVQLAMRASLPKYLPADGIALQFPECALRAHPGGGGQGSGPGGAQG